MAKILLVEDDKFLSILLKKRLGDEGIEVYHAVDGEAALDFLKNNKFDLVLMDIILPNKSGFEAMADILANPQYNKAPIIVLSNLGQDEDIKKGKDLGAVDYLVKAKVPIDLLINKIKSFLSAK